MYQVKQITRSLQFFAPGAMILLYMVFFCFDQNIKITVADLIFNNDFVDIHFIYTHDHQAYNFLTNELLQIC